MSAPGESDGRLIVIFDGRCGLCNGLVQWLLRRDRQDRLRFVAVDSAAGVALLAKYGLDSAEAERTILLVHEADQWQGALIRTEAVVALLKELPSPWPLVSWVLRWIPLPMRDAGYRIVAHMRYRIWGKLEHCPLPSEDERERFL